MTRALPKRVPPEAETRLLPLREAQADAARQRLLQAAFSLVEAGEEPTMRNVAQAAGVAERTIYRHFENRDALYDAIQPLFTGKTGLPLCGSIEEIEEYARALFTIFDRNRTLLRTLLTSPWAADSLRKTRPANLVALRALLDTAFPRAPVAERAAAASTLRALLSGSAWQYLSDCGLDADTIVAHSRWSIRTVLASLRRRAR